MESKSNVMRQIEIEKVVLNCGGTGEKLDRAVKLLEMIASRKAKRIASTKRIPSFGVRPGLETGCVVTVRGKEKMGLLKRLLGGVDNKIKKKQVKENSFSFGIREYLEIPGAEYQREIGILGFDVTVVFRRKGRRVAMRKRKRGRLPKKQHVSSSEIASFLENKFYTEIEEK